jgi:1,4-dihydroxy-2-naphthoate octaprenyltransferase
VRTVRAGARAGALIAVLVQTGRLQLVYGALATLGLALGG